MSDIRSNLYAPLRRPRLAALFGAAIVAASFSSVMVSPAIAQNTQHQQWYKGPGNSQSMSMLMQLWGEAEIVILVRRDVPTEIEPSVLWSDLPLHPDAREILVPAGSSLAAAAAQIRNGSGDRLLLQRGGHWNEPFPRWGVSGLSAEYPIVIGAYGVGPRPVIVNHFPFRSAHGSAPLDNIVIGGLHLRAPNTWNGLGGDAVGIWVQRTGDMLVIDDCRIEGFANNIVIEGVVENGRSDFRLLRSVLADPYRIDSGNANLLVSSVHGLLIENNAIINTLANDARGNLHSHGIYLSQANTPGTAVVRGNLLYNARTNITMRGGGVIENNLSIRGGQGITTSDSYNGPATARIAGNVVAESRNHWDGQLLGLGIDANYVDTTIENNIVFGATHGSSHIGITLSNTGGEVRDNIVYAWSRPGEGQMSPALVVKAFAGGAPHPITVTDNRFVQTQPQFVVWDRTNTAFSNLVTYNDNSYHTPRGRQMFIDEDRRGYTFEQLAEPGSAWLKETPASWPTSLEQVLGEPVESWIESIRHTWTGAEALQTIEQVRMQFE